MLSRGFWLYVWIIEASDGQVVHYVGRTGDSSSLNAQSPFARMSLHLGSNKSANQLRKHLARVEIVPEACKRFELVSYGPILPEAKGKMEHRERRDAVAALEKALCDDLDEAGYRVMNSVKCKKDRDAALWSEVRNAFASRFDRLAQSRQA
jgi:hypothetical protein